MLIPFRDYGVLYYYLCRFKNRSSHLRLLKSTLCTGLAKSTHYRIDAKSTPDRRERLPPGGAMKAAVTFVVALVIAFPIGLALSLSSQQLLHHSRWSGSSGAAPHGAHRRRGWSSVPPSTTQVSSSHVTVPDEAIVPMLLAEVRRKPQNATLLASCIERLELRGRNAHSVNSTAADRFDALLGLYDVSFVKTTKEGDNPVGGTWTRKAGIAQRILRSRRSFQHILAVNETGAGQRLVQIDEGAMLEVVGEAVNVISLEALWGLLRTTIILRGDAVAINATERTSDRFCQPLSAFAVRALFDAPRIAIGREGRYVVNVNVGPKTSVVLDAVYVDEAVRIGVGGRSGSRFVFARCAAGDAEANEFRAVLARKPRSRAKTLTGAFAVAALGAFCGVNARGVVRILGCSVALVSSFAGGLVSFSGGGIEAGDQSVIK